MEPEGRESGQRPRTRAPPSRYTPSGSALNHGVEAFTGVYRRLRPRQAIVHCRGRCVRRDPSKRAHGANIRRGTNGTHWPRSLSSCGTAATCGVPGAQRGEVGGPWPPEELRNIHMHGQQEQSHKNSRQCIQLALFLHLHDSTEKTNNKQICSHFTQFISQRTISQQELKRKIDDKLKYLEVHSTSVYHF